MKKIVILLLLCKASFGQEYPNVIYANTAQRALDLDIYVPKTVKNQVLMVWIHGGAWQNGNKENPPKQLLERGYFLASVNFRSSPEAPFPAMVHDIKAAIRYLRGNASKYGYHPNKIVLWGSSSGGHLAALVGLSAGNAYLEGTLGQYLSTSSQVQLIVDFYGPSNFSTILAQSTPHGQNVRRPALALFFGKPVDEKLEEYKTASPVNYVSASSPPMFLAHGNQDPQVPINQTLELWALLQKYAVKSELEILQETAHGGGMFAHDQLYNKLQSFIESSLKEAR
jgi:acetyl esterase/lipase